MDDGLAKARGLGEARGAGNDSVKHSGAKMLADFADDLRGKAGAGVKHGHDDAENFQARIDAGIADLAENTMASGDAFEGVILALQWDDEEVRGGEGVETEEAEGWRAVNHNEVEGAACHDGLQHARKAMQMIFRLGHFQFRAAQIDFARDDGQILEGGGLDFFGEAAFAKERAIGAGAFEFFEADTAGGVGLGIKIEQKRPFAGDREAGGDVDGGSCLADATFLIRQTYHSGRHEHKMGLGDESLKFKLRVRDGIVGVWQR